MTLKSLPTRWLTLAVAATLYAGFGAVITSIAPFISSISDDLRVTPSQMGTVLGVWQLVYIGTSYLVGLTLDRIGIRRTLAAGSLLIPRAGRCRE